jgi:glyoxylase-like metal-dependent hydrolase (beta-lactamase superfamily II)
MVEIIPFRSGINTCYIVKDKGMVLIDAATPGEGKSFAKLLSDSGIRPEEIQLIILTHGDFDHCGGAKEIQELTGAKIVLHEKDRKNLEQSIFNWPEGATTWGRISHSLFMPLVKRMIGEIPAAKVDIALDDKELSLKEYGLDGKIVYTPGHTSGSISVILDSGEAFVGCMAHNRLPFVFRPKLPIYAMDPELIKESWVKVINMGARTIYPGHGKSFPVEKITKYLN